MVFVATILVAGWNDLASTIDNFCIFDCTLSSKCTLEKIYIVINE